MSKVKLELAGRDVPNKIELGKHVVTEMTTNAATFVDPDPSLADLTDVTDALELAYDNSKKGLLSTALLNDAEKAWNVIMTAMGNYVDSVAKGGRGIINKAGMDATEPNHAAVPMTKVEGVESKTGAVTGDLFFDWNAVKRARIYRGILVPENGTKEDEIEVFTTKTKFLFKGLKPGVKYLLVLQAIGASGIGPASDPASGYAAF
jgi:hypothetical protein